jgi:hypothetical protein
MPLQSRFWLLEKVKLCVLDTHWWSVLWRCFSRPGEKAFDCSARSESLWTSGVQQLRDTCVRFSLDWTGLLATRIALCISEFVVVVRIKASHFQCRTFEIRRHVESVAKSGYTIVSRTCESCSITIGRIYSQDAWRDAVDALCRFRSYRRLLNRKSNYPIFHRH